MINGKIDIHDFVCEEFTFISTTKLGGYRYKNKCSYLSTSKFLDYGLYSSLLHVQYLPFIGLILLVPEIIWPSS